MRMRTVLIGLLAVICGITAAVGVHTFLQVGTQDASRPVKTISVVVAVKDLPTWAVVSAGDVKVDEWPEHLAAPGTIQKLEDAVGRAVLKPLLVGEELLEGNLAAKGAHAGMAGMVPDGMRAFTISTPDVSAGVGGFLLPGNRVDVLLTVASAPQHRQGMSITLLQNVLILAVDKRVEASSAKTIEARELRSVTLVVSPEEAGKLTLAQSKGTLHLSLRNPNDGKTADRNPVTLIELDDLAALRPAAPAPLDAATPELSPSGSAADKSAAQGERKTPAVYYIRTLRGMSEGDVLVETRPHPR